MHEWTPHRTNLQQCLKNSLKKIHACNKNSQSKFTKCKKWKKENWRKRISYQIIPMLFHHRRKHSWLYKCSCRSDDQQLSWASKLRLFHRWWRRDKKFHSVHCCWALCHHEPKKRLPVGKKWPCKSTQLHILFSVRFLVALQTWLDQN